MQYRRIIIFVAVLSCLANGFAFAQFTRSTDSLLVPYSKEILIRPQFHYNISSNFVNFPGIGSLRGMTISPFLSYPLTPKISIAGGIIAGRYYSAFKNNFSENWTDNPFNTLSIYGSATYRVNNRFSVYGTGIKQLAGTVPLFNMPSQSFLIGSRLNFGNFSVGATIQVSNLNNYYMSSPFGVDQSYFSTYPLK